ncbi:MAG: hypothetical protein AB8B70_06850 [Prochlorococcus sp.]
MPTVGASWREIIMPEKMKTCRAGILSHLYVSSGFSEIDHGNELMHGAAKRMLEITKQHGNSQAAWEQPSKPMIIQGLVLMAEFS